MENFLLGYSESLYLWCVLSLWEKKGGVGGGWGCEDTGIELVIYVDYTIVLVGYMVKED